MAAVYHVGYQVRVAPSLDRFAAYMQKSAELLRRQKSRAELRRVSHGWRIILPPACPAGPLTSRRCVLI
jgi:hypothetical protein